MRISAIVLILVSICINIDTAFSGESSDSEPPQVLSFSYHPTEVVTGDDDVFITAHIIDNPSGLSNGSCLRQLSHAHFYSADWNDSRCVNLSSTPEGNLVQGNAYDGIYTAKIDVSNLQSGDWILDHIYLVDNNGNSRTIDERNLSTLGIPRAFTINWDLTGIEMVRISIPSILFMLLFMMITLYSIGFKSTRNGPRGYVLAIFSSIKQIYNAEDGFPSTSKAQFFIWTFVAVLAYLMIFSDRIIMHSIWRPPSEIPYHLLLAMGLSVITASMAHAINVRNPQKEINSGIQNASKIGLLTDENGNPDLSKIQMIAWTGVAVSVFFLEVIHNIWWNPSPPQIPDIDEALLALMGIGQGAYITKKAISTRGASEESSDQVPRQEQ